MHRPHTHSIVYILFGILLTTAIAANTSTSNRGVVADVEALKKHSPPIGTIMAYAGEWPIADPDRTQKESECGWMLCDGRALATAEYPELFGAIGKCHGSPQTNFFNLPDARGMFLRGVDTIQDPKIARDIDRDFREAANPEGNSGKAVGSYQSWATGLPKDKKNRFKTGGNNDGAHSHSVTAKDRSGRCNNAELVFDRVLANGKNLNVTATNADPFTSPLADEPNIVDSQPMAPGVHFHEIHSGGDHETRPVNISVFWIIKARK